MRATFDSAAEYDRLVQDLIGSGVISDRGMIYFDVRPSAHAPTLELRVCDACPSVDTAVLIAGLFRAVVTRERARLRARRAVADAVVGNPAGGDVAGRALGAGRRAGRPVGSAPGAGGRLAAQRWWTTCARSWKQTGPGWSSSELCEAALAQGSSAARQREALRKHARIADVVDLLVAETAGRVPAGAPAQAAPVLPGYHPGEYDEAVRADGQPRPSHAAVLEMLASLPAETLRAADGGPRAAKEPMGVGVSRSRGQTAAASFQVDIVPRVVSAEDWSRLQGGTAQRARALEAFLNDIYGKRQIVRDGVLPGLGGDRSARASARQARRSRRGNGASRWPGSTSSATATAAGWCWRTTSACRRASPTPSLAAACCAAPAPSSSAQSTCTIRKMRPRCCAARWPNPPPPPRRRHRSFACSRRGRTTRRTSSIAGWPTAMDIPLVTAPICWSTATWSGSSMGASGAAWTSSTCAWTIGWHARRGADGQPLGPGLVKAVRAGRVALANALGNGVADDKATYAFVPALIDYYLGERPLLDQVRTYHCADPEQRREVMSRLDQLVVKPVDGYGGLGVVIGPHATDHELAGVRALIQQQPARWVAQETVALSTHPTFAPGDPR